MSSIVMSGRLIVIREKIQKEQRPAAHAPDLATCLLRVWDASPDANGTGIETRRTGKDHNRKRQHAHLVDQGLRAGLLLDQVRVNCF